MVLGFFSQEMVISGTSSDPHLFLCVSLGLYLCNTFFDGEKMTQNTFLNELHTKWVRPFGATDSDKEKGFGSASQTKCNLNQVIKAQEDLRWGQGGEWVGRREDGILQLAEDRITKKLSKVI